MMMTMTLTELFALGDQVEEEAIAVDDIGAGVAGVAREVASKLVARHSIEYPRSGSTTQQSIEGKTRLYQKKKMSNYRATGAAIK